MAGVVDANSNLRVTGSGGGGSNVTITGPLGSEPAASSVSVAIASDQLPLPVSVSGGGGPVTIADGADVAEGHTTDPAYTSGAGTVISLLKAIFAASSGGGLADIQVLPHATWTSGSPATTTFNTPASGTLYLYFHGTWTGNIAVSEQYDTGGAFTGSQGYIIPTTVLNNTRLNWQPWFGQFGFYATDFVIAITVKGIAFQITNNIASGSATVTGLFKRNDESVKPVVNIGAVNPFGADVNSFNELNVTRVNTSQQWEQNPTVDGISPSSAHVPIDGAIPYLFNGATFDRAPGDKTNGAKVQGTVAVSSITNPVTVSSITNPVTVTGAVTIPTPVPTKQSITATATGTINGTGQVLPIDTTGASTVIVTCPSSSGGLTANFIFEGTTDGTNWQQIYARSLIGYNAAVDGSTIKSFDPNQVIPNQTVFVIPCGGFAQVRLNCTFLIAGSITFFLSATPDTDSFHDDYVRIFNSPLKVGITDSFGNNAQIAPAFSAASTSNTAFVVALSPNTPLNVNSLPLPPNAALETGGNLALQVAYLYDLIVPLLLDIRTEMRIMNEYARNGFNIDDESESMRRDPAFTS